MSSDLHYSNLEAPILDASRDGNKKFGRGSDMLGFWPVVFTVTNGMIGPVILVVPYSFFLIGIHGWALYIFAFIIFWFTGHLLYKAQVSKPGEPYESYPSIAEGLLGKFGRAVIGLSITIELLGLCSAFVVIVGDNLVKVQPLQYIGIELSKYVWIIVFACVVLPSVLMQNYSILAEMSKLGVLVCFSIPLIVLMSAWLYPVHNYYRPEEVAIEGPSFDWNNLPLALGIVGVAYSTHAVFPSIVSRMRNVDEFPGALKISFMVVTLFYIVAGFGFYIYGKATDPQITFNLGPSAQTIISYAIILVILLKFALMLNPVVLELEEICRSREDLRAYFCTSEKDKRPIRALRISLVAFCVFLALMVPYIALIHSVVGVDTSNTYTETLSLLGI
mmetsp:Transcript_3999/g.5903  ORF Transcript_3999/g.5903 Transcript_3999/m.5903 type:complete len:390 (-) Transcript_3999:520-1689(-)